MTELTEEQRKEWEEKLKTMTPDEIATLQKQQCIFCQIISGKVPSKKIYEDDLSIAILDINPATKGHVLLIPKEHYSIMPQLPDNVLGHLNVVARDISQAMLRGIGASGTNIFVANGLVAGQRAQHFMIHVIPRKDGDKLLDLEEKLIDKDVQDKVKIAVENKLNELLGVKKKTIEVQEKLEEEIIDKEESNQGQDSEEQEEVKKETVEKVEDQEEIDESNKDQEEETEDDDKEQDEETDDEEPDSEDNEKEGKDVSLDDIANLFK